MSILIKLFLIVAVPLVAIPFGALIGFTFFGRATVYGRLPADVTAGIVDVAVVVLLVGVAYSVAGALGILWWRRRLYISGPS